MSGLRSGIGEGCDSSDFATHERSEVTHRVGLLGANLRNGLPDDHGAHELAVFLNIAKAEGMAKFVCGDMGDFVGGHPLSSLAESDDADFGCDLVVVHVRSPLDSASECDFAFAVHAGVDVGIDCVDESDGDGCVGSVGNSEWHVGSEDVSPHFEAVFDSGLKSGSEGFGDIGVVNSHVGSGCDE